MVSELRCLSVRASRMNVFLSLLTSTLDVTGASAGLLDIINGLFEFLIEQMFEGLFGLIMLLFELILDILL
jgi:hypothetical protein